MYACLNGIDKVWEMSLSIMWYSWIKKNLFTKSLYSTPLQFAVWVQGENTLIVFMNVGQCVCISRLGHCFCLALMNDANHSRNLFQTLHAGSTSVHLAHNSFGKQCSMWYISMHWAITVACHIVFPFTCSLDPHTLQFPKVTQILKGRLSGLFLTNLPWGCGGWHCCWGYCSEPNCCHVMRLLTPGKTSSEWKI